MLMIIMHIEQEILRKKDPDEEEQDKTCYCRYTEYTKATNDIETVISIDKTIGEISHVHENTFIFFFFLLS